MAVVFEIFDCEICCLLLPLITYHYCAGWLSYKLLPLVANMDCVVVLKQRWRSNCCINPQTVVLASFVSESETHYELSVSSHFVFQYMLFMMPQIDDSSTLCVYFHVLAVSSQLVFFNFNVINCLFQKCFSLEC